VQSFLNSPSQLEKQVDEHMNNEMKLECTFSLIVDFDDALFLQKLQQLKTDKSPGLNWLHPMLLSCCAEELCLPLSLILIYKKSYDTRILPDDWKTASVCTDYKKGCINDAANYRPVLLTSIPCKVMESIVRDTLLHSVTDKNILSCHQHGCRKRRSCLTNLLEIFEARTSALDKCFTVDVIYFDYRNACDTVPHNHLLLKLTNFGLHGDILRWIRNR